MRCYIINNFLIKISSQKQTHHSKTFSEKSKIVYIRIKIKKRKKEKHKPKSSKDKIVELFTKNVRNKRPNLQKKHCGSEGHWLEKQFGVTPNSSNTPDILGYEIKKESRKITFGDFSASEYIYSAKRPVIEKTNNWNTDTSISRTDFIRYFGSKNKIKNRYSWSGKCVPKYPTTTYTENGQRFAVTTKGDICIYYSFTEDTRTEIKHTFPPYFKKNNLLIAIWYKDKIADHINKKFNQNGFVICKKQNKKFTKICFGKPLNYQTFLTNFINGKIFFDSGMYETNCRNYSQFRATSSFWNNLIIEEF